MKASCRERDEQGQRTTVHDLPDDCLALVFPFLHSLQDKNSASLTCRRWRALEALSRHSLRFSRSRSITALEWPRLHHHLLHALRTFPHILSITIECSLKALPGSFFNVLDNRAFAQLKALHFHMVTHTDIDDRVAGCLARSCPSLTHFSTCASLITDAGLHSLAHGCRLLESLDVTDSDITDKGVDVVLAMCSNMTEITVSGSLDITGWGFRHGKNLRTLVAVESHMSDAGLAEGLQGATSLETLNLPYIEDGWPRLSVIAEFCKLMVDLCLTLSETLDDVSLQQIAQECRNLQVLEVGGCDRVTLHGWQALSVSAIRLEELAVNGCERFCEHSLLAIKNGCPKLRSLKLADRFFPPHPIFHQFQEMCNGRTH